MNQTHGKHGAFPARSIPISPEELLGKRMKRNDSLRAKALRWLAGFLILMLLLTLLSRAADELTIPRASTAAPAPKTIDRKITAAGKAEETAAFSVTTVAGIRVASVSVKSGSRVEAGSSLFILDTADLQQKLEDVKEELFKLDLDIRDQESRDALNGERKKLELARARQDYEEAKKSGDKAVSEAANALEKAKKALAAYTPASGPDLSDLEADRAAAEKGVLLAEGALSKLREETENAARSVRENAEAAGEDPDAAEQATRDQAQASLDTAEDNLEKARTKLNEAREALEGATAGGSSTEKQELENAVAAAQREYEQAVESRDSALKASSRAIEDAGQKEAEDSSGEIKHLERSKLEKQINTLEAILQDGGVIYAQKAGTVTKLELEVGSVTPEGTSVLFADNTQSTMFIAQIQETDGKYATPGTEVLLKPQGNKEPISGLTIESTYKDTENPELINVAVRLPKGILEVGGSADLEILQKSEEYPICVPLSALREENGSYFVLIPIEKKGILGTELVAERADVTVLEKNGSYAALSSDWVYADREFITSTSKPIKAGDRIRLEES